jgi:hypothetical protein
VQQTDKKEWNKAERREGDEGMVGMKGGWGLNIQQRLKLKPT